MSTHQQTEEIRNRFLKSTVRRFAIALNAAAEPSIRAYLNNSEAFSISQEPIIKAYVQTYQIVGVYFAKSTLRELDKIYKKDAASELTPTWLRFMEDYALQKAGERITSVTNTTLTQVRKVINNAVSEGLGTAETGRNIRQKWSEITRYRSEMIARTEIISSGNMGSILGARATGIDLKKTWLAAVDGRERQSHKEADGQKINLNDKFYVGGYPMDHPGDPDAPAEETIQCRCTVTFEV